MSKEVRKHLSGKEKIRLLKKHLVDKKPISEVCSSEKVLPGSFHQWVRELFDRGDVVFESMRRKKDPTHEYERKIAVLEAKLVQKNEVIAELMQETIKLKKASGEI